MGHKKLQKCNLLWSMYLLSIVLKIYVRLRIDELELQKLPGVGKFFTGGSLAPLTPKKEMLFKKEVPKK